MSTDVKLYLEFIYMIGYDCIMGCLSFQVCLHMDKYTQKFARPIKSLALFLKVTALRFISGPLPREQQVSDANRHMASWEM